MNLQLAVFLVILGVGADGSRTAHTDEQAVNRMICGPRCVTYVLEHYGQQAELIDIVQSIQGPIIEQGATLQAISSYLVQRGLKTRLVAIDRGECPDICGLAIVARKTSGDMCHFVVATPTDHTSGTIHYFDGINGVLNEQARTFWSDNHTVLLLIGKDNPIEVVPMGTLMINWAAALSYLVGGFVLVCSLVFRFHKRLRS